MAESFYELLGVPEDADEADLRAAYRAQVKRHHPDVSDEPGAARRFSRLTTARDVLLDSEERARYDSLGHAVYVERHVDGPANAAGSAWDGAGGTTDPTGPGGGAAGRSGRTARGGWDERATRSGQTGSGHTSEQGTAGAGTWLGESGEGPATTGSADHRRRRGRRRHVRESPTDRTAADGTAAAAGVDEPWQRASATYRRSEAASAAAARQRDGDLADVLAAVGPWVFVHLVVLVSALATVWVTLSEAGRYVHLTLPGLLVGFAIFGGVSMLLVLHLVSRLYT